MGTEIKLKLGKNKLNHSMRRKNWVRERACACGCVCDRLDHQHIVYLNDLLHGARRRFETEHFQMLFYHSIAFAFGRGAV